MGLGGTRCEGRPEDQCHQDKVNAYWYQTWCVGSRGRGDRIKEVDEFYGSIVSKKGGTDGDIEAQIGKARQGSICDAETNMVIHSTNNQDQAKSLWVKCEGGALVWL